MNKKLLLLGFIIISIVLNIFLLKITWFKFTGIVLSVLIFGTVLIHLLFKFLKRKAGYTDADGEPNSFIFPDNMAKKMKKVDLGIQMESSVVSISFLILGMIGFNIYIIFFSTIGLPFKIFMVFNSIFGVILMSMMLITYYHQLISYRESTKFISEFAQSNLNKANNYKTERRKMH